MTRPRQLDLFPPVVPRNADEAAIVAQLLDAARGKPVRVGRMSSAAFKRLMTPLPAITVPW